MEKVFRLRFEYCLLACLVFICIGAIFISFYLEVGKLINLFFGGIWILVGGFPFCLLVKWFYLERREGMSLITTGERLYRESLKKQSRLNLVGGLLALFAALGFAPLFVFGFLGWAYSDPIEINWAFCVGGLGLSAICWLARRNLWI